MLKSILNITADRNYNFSFKERAGKKYLVKEEGIKDSVVISQEYELLQHNNCKLYKIKKNNNFIEIIISSSGMLLRSKIELSGKDQGKFAVVESSLEGYTASFTFSRKRIDLTRASKFSHIVKFLMSLKKLNVKSEINDDNCRYLEAIYNDYSDELHTELNIAFEIMVRIAENKAEKVIDNSILYKSNFILLKLNNINTNNE